MAVSDAVFCNFTVSDNRWLFVEYLSSRKVQVEKIEMKNLIFQINKGECS